MMLDVAAAREGFRDKILSDMGFVRTNHNIADSLMKSMLQSLLQKILTEVRLSIELERWIIRD